MSCEGILAMNGLFPQEHTYTANGDCSVSLCFFCDNFDGQLYLINSYVADINQFQEGPNPSMKQTVKPQVLEKWFETDRNGTHMSRNQGLWESYIQSCLGLDSGKLKS